MNYSKLDNLKSKFNYTIPEIAKRVGRSKGWYDKMRNKKNMTVLDLEALAKLYDVSPAYFFDDYIEPIKDIEQLRKDLKTQKEMIELLKLIVEKQKNEISQLEKKEK